MFLIKNATIIDPSSPMNGDTVDLLIEAGTITNIGKHLTYPTAKVIEETDLQVSPGWLDIGAQIGEPGFEHREDLQSVTAAAAAGGFTALACFPNTNPTIHSKSEVSFLKNNVTLVDFYPIGALSRDCAGENLAEVYDMAASGAIAFSDGAKSIASAGLMKRGLEYLKGINGLVINHPNDASLSKGGQIHEGEISTILGMKGIPALAEILMLKRDLDLLAYTNSRLHVHNVSTAEAIKLIKAAKNKGLKITASVSVMHLIYNHSAVENFDPNYKLNPPLREKTDTKALIKGIKEGIIDVINSNHTPLEIEAKKLEFSYADAGIIGLETLYPLLNTHLGKQLNTSSIVNLLAIQPRTVLNLPIPKIAIGEKANLTLFQAGKEWTFTQKDIQSKSKNTPFIEQQFKGKVLGTINGKLSNC
ncbi:MAG: dihydroorotase family protein [Saprospiraceae bacterium]